MTPDDAGHWLAGEIARVRALAEALPAATPSRDGRDARAELLEAISALVREVAGHAGVEACFASHEGLLVAVAGESPGFDALAAMAQHGLEPAREAAVGAALGPLRQMVLVGETGKLALLCLGPLTLGILSPSRVDLGGALAR